MGSTKCPKTTLIAPQSSSLKDYQQDFRVALQNKLVHNRKKTIMNEVLVDASLMEECNKIKQELETEQRKSSFIEASGSSRKKEFERLKEGLITALVSLEFQPLPSPYSEPAFMSTSKIFSGGHLNGGTSSKDETERKEKQLLRKEIMAFPLYRDLARLIMTFFVGEMSYALYFPAEVCDSTYYSCHSIVDWKPNDFISKTKRLLWKGS